MSTGELLLEGLVVTLFAMVIVFSVLIIISFIIRLQTFLVAKVSAPKKNVKEEILEPAIVEEIEEEMDDSDELELVAAITAAISLYTNLPESRFSVKSIVRRNDNLNWRKASL
ncbi:MAG: OadG family protein [Clostridiaceae bacterium]